MAERNSRVDILDLLNDDSDEGKCSHDDISNEYSEDSEQRQCDFVDEDGTPVTRTFHHSVWQCL